jgi:uncharacterized repeat protein (TIGR03803 family)
MELEGLSRACIFEIRLQSRRITTVALILLAGVVLVSGPSARAQTYQIIHDFVGRIDGANPQGRLSIDRGGHLFGTAFSGALGSGVVFKMALPGANWTFSALHTFSRNEAGDPAGGVVIGADGSLYGTTSNDGTVFNVKPTPTPPPTAFNPWKLNSLYSFAQVTDVPAGDVVFDAAGTIYGVTSTGGGDGCFNLEGCGTVYELSRSGNTWTQQTLYAFQGGDDGNNPRGVAFDSAGDLIGTTLQGGANDKGTIFKLAHSGGSWTESVLYNFDCGNGGCAPMAGLTADAAGNLYGSTTNSQFRSGTIFEFSPSSGGGTYTVLAQIPTQYRTGPYAALTMDSAGNLYGTVAGDSVSPGDVFEVTHGSGGWSFVSLHDFTGAPSDGANPESTATLAPNGKIYGTASSGGSCGGTGCGVVWEITP